jgi:PAS domain S-box-containing protein
MDETTQRLVAIVESSDDAILTKTLDGIITSWNAGAERIFGYKAEEIVGQSVLTLIPPDRHHEETGIVARIVSGERINHYETVRRRKDGTSIDVSLSVSPLKNAEGKIVGASKIARDITDRAQTERILRRQTLRLETLNRISKIISAELDLERTVQAVTDIATELTGAKFGAFFYNAMNEAGEIYMLYTLSGAPREAFEKFGMPRNTPIFEPTFRGEGVVRVSDIRKDARYGKNPPHHGMPKGHLPVVSYLAVPVKSRSGEVIGGLFFGHDQPDIFGEEAEELVTGIAPHAAIAIDNAQLYRAMQEEVASRRRAEEAKELLLSEIQHRVKNTLATVQAIASQTLRSTPRDERKSFAARLQALAGAHDLLTQQNWDRADVADLVARAIAPFRERSRDRFDVSGPGVGLNAARSLLLAMILHELATNAVKYGALSNDQGRVAMRWNVETAAAGQGDRQQLILTWSESGGPVVHEPPQKGFGSTLIERALEGNHGRSEVAFLPSGLVCTLKIAI